jgi:DNA-binding transcriptional LysR family regulator
MSGKSLRNLDLNLMVVFEAIYASGSISHAASHLAMTQPAVSNALARLRAVLGDPLFVRIPSGMEPTQRAREMIGPIREALKLIGAQVDRSQIDLSTYQRHFRIIMFDPLEAVVMPPVYNLLTVQMPKVTLECIPAFRTDFVQELVEGTVDLACHAYPSPTPDIVTERIGSSEVVLVARRGHPAFRKPLSLQTLDEVAFVALVPDLRSKIMIEQSLVAQGTSRRIAFTVGKVSSFPPMIEGTDLVGILPRWYARHIMGNFAIETHELPIPMIDQSSFMTWHVRNTEDPGHRWLRGAIMQAFRAATAGTTLALVKS